MAKGLFTALFNALSDPKSYYAMQKEMNMKAVAETFFNTLAGKTVFEAVALPEDIGEAVIFDGRRAVRVRPLGIYDLIIPEPCEFKDLETRKRILSLHPIAYPDSGEAATIIEADQNPFEGVRIIECFFKDGPQSSGRLRGLTYRKKTIRGFSGASADYQCLFGENIRPGARSAFAGGGYAPNVPTGENFPDGTPVLTNFGGNHIVEKIEKKLKVSTSVVTGVGSTLAAAQAQQEINFWKNKNEKNAGTKGNIDKSNAAYKRIQLYNYYGIEDRKRENGKPYRKVEEYWPNYATDDLLLKRGVGGSSEEGTGDSVTGIMHWSATSVSWAMRGTGFPARYGHSGYSQNIAYGKAESWEAHSLIRQKVIPKLGDVVVKPAGHGKKSTTNTASHGDIIIKIDEQFAYTAGGNLGERGTFKQTRQMKLAPDGTILSPKPYLIILKKMK